LLLSVDIDDGTYFCLCKSGGSLSLGSEGDRFHRVVSAPELFCIHDPWVVGSAQVIDIIRCFGLGRDGLSVSRYDYTSSQVSVTLRDRSTDRQQLLLCFT
jgi:hypothetical protein